MLRYMYRLLYNHQGHEGHPQVILGQTLNIHATCSCIEFKVRTPMHPPGKDR